MDFSDQEILASNSLVRKSEDVSNYGAAFLYLYEYNDRVNSILEEKSGLLSNQEYFRQDISKAVAVMKNIRELRPPKE